MSSINGAKARSHRERKAKRVLRERMRELRKKLGLRTPERSTDA